MATPYLDKILALTPKTPEASTVPEPFGSPSGPGLWHHKGWQLPPYIQHVAHELVKKGHDESKAINMAVGIVKDWAHGHNGKHRVHPDVQAAAAKNIAKWEELKAKAHAEHGAKDAEHAGKEGDGKSDHHVAASAPAASPSGFLAGKPTNPGVVTAPGAKPSGTGKLQQQPSQTNAASPPLPPGTKLPSPDDINQLATTIGGDTEYTLSAQKHLQSASKTLSTGDYMGALHLLRSAQTDMNQELRDREDKVSDATAPAMAETGFGGRVPPAEMSSRRSEMFAAQAQLAKVRKQHRAVTNHIDAIRRYHFHGVYAGSPSSRV